MWEGNFFEQFRLQNIVPEEVVRGCKAFLLNFSSPL